MAVVTSSNQAPPLEGHNLFDTDRALVEALRREGGGWAEEQASAFGDLAGGAPLEWGRLANEHPPVLRTHDRWGNRIDEVEYHPAWHDLMRMSVGAGLHALPWREPREGAHVARAAMFFVSAQVEAGHGCPVSMTYASLPTLRHAPALAAEWEPRLTSLDYDSGALCGMALTEKQGGSDVRANETRATPFGGDEYELHGHKWFCSAPMCDVFLMLAQTENGVGVLARNAQARSDGDGPTCFLVPRVLPDGTRNGIRLERLKDKLGNRSNASAEIELDGAWGRIVGEEGRGVRTIIEMVNHTRLDCTIGSAAGMRAAVAQATHHAAHRSAFGRLLVDQPLMANVLADLCLESEAATATALRLARAYDEGDRPFARLATAVAKYWVCRRAPAHAAEALEVLGGNGYVEESPLPRLFRESPLNGIWEGAGNVIALDVLRALAREPESAAAFLAEVRLGLPGLAAELEPLLAAPDESGARRLVERMALALQGSLLVRHAPAAVAEAFCASRLDGDWGRAFGTLPAGVDARAIVDRASPH